MPTEWATPFVCPSPLLGFARLPVDAEHVKHILPEEGPRQVLEHEQLGSLLR